jgi:diguanylate cyclase (GGDEF)-like protein
VSGGYLRPRPPEALIIDNKDWSARSLESVLTPAGYEVVRVTTGMKGVERARARPPDVVLINFNLPDGNGVGLCHILRAEPRFGSSIPIIVLSTGHATRQQRLAALEAGAWEFLTYPFDAQELLLRLDQYITAKFEIDRVHQDSLVDEPSELYSNRGLERRAHELRALAFRQEQPMACVVLAPAFESEAEAAGAGTDIDAIEAAVNQIGHALRAAGRTSDAIGKIGRTEFAIIAPATDAEGAVLMAQRLARAIEQENGKDAGKPPFKMRAGYEAVTNVREAQIEAHDLVERAAIAMRRAKPNGDTMWIQGFDQEEPYRH